MAKGSGSRRNAQSQRRTIAPGAAQGDRVYKKAFGAVEEEPPPGPGGRIMHAISALGDSAVVCGGEMPEWGALAPKSLTGSPVIIHPMSRTPAAFERALNAGTNVTMPLGMRSGETAHGK